jgi:hypothetical protein
LGDVIAVDGRERVVELEHVLVRRIVREPLNRTAAVGVASGGEARPIAHHRQRKLSFRAGGEILRAGDVAEISENKEEFGGVKGTIGGQEIAIFKAVGVEVAPHGWALSPGGGQSSVPDLAGNLIIAMDRIEGVFR